MCNSVLETLLTEFFPKAGGNFPLRFGVEYIPCFLSCLELCVMSLCILIVRMDLYGEPFAGEKKLYQNRADTGICRIGACTQKLRMFL